jgi:hypothetical protein
VGCLESQIIGGNIAAVFITLLSISLQGKFKPTANHRERLTVMLLSQTSRR